MSIFCDLHFRGGAVDVVGSNLIVKVALYVSGSSPASLTSSVDHSCFRRGIMYRAYSPAGVDISM